MSKKKSETKTESAQPGLNNENAASTELPITILAQYIRDASFENPKATDVLRGGQNLPEMDIGIGVDARKVPDEKINNLYEVALNIRAEAKQNNETVFIAELQYGVTLVIHEQVPEENHHPLLLIEVPRMAFPYARQIISNLTIDGGYPPLLLSPVDFHALYLQRFGKEIEEARKNLQK